MSQTTPQVYKETKLKSLKTGDRVIYAQREFPFLGSRLSGCKGLLISISDSSKTVMVLFDGESCTTEVEYRALSKLTSGE